jgi:hypothetical protein
MQSHRGKRAGAEFDGMAFIPSMVWRVSVRILPRRQQAREMLNPAPYLPRNGSTAPGRVQRIHRGRGRLSLSWLLAHVRPRKTARRRFKERSEAPAQPSCKSKTHDLGLQVKYSATPFNKLNDRLKIVSIPRDNTCYRTTPGVADRPPDLQEHQASFGRSR